MTSIRTIAFACLPLAWAGVAPAHAQSGVSISGLLDLGVYRGFDKVTHVGTVKRSDVAISGREDLGGGLHITFRLQHRLDLDTGLPEGVGSKPFWQGESTVGVQGSFGHVRLGRALDVVSNNDWLFDPWGNFDRIASPAWNNWHWNYASDRTSNNGLAEYGRLANGVFYDSPMLGAFSVHFSGAIENSPGGGTGDNGGVALKYGEGSVNALVAASRNSSGDTVQFVGLSWGAGAWTVMGALDRSVFRAAVDSTAKVTSLGLNYAVGKSNLKLGWARRDVDGAVSNFVGLGAEYNLSKRNSLYVSLGRNDSDAGAATSAYGAGISHSF